MPPNDADSLKAALAGCLLGGAIGDSLGLPAEGVSRRRLARWYPGPWRQRFLFGRGLVSDDTEHAFFVANSLLEAGADAGLFARRLARRLRWWLAAVPAGVGWATLRAILRLWVGFGVERSGVVSAGNGPAMRAPLLGVFFHDQPERLAEFVRASTRLTHVDPRAEVGALAVARLGALAVRAGGGEVPYAAALESLRACGPADAEWNARLDELAAAWEEGSTVAAFADRLGLARGVSGYVYHTVPVAAYAWLRHWGDFRQALEAVLVLGGDTDTVGAIAGALAGASGGQAGLPADWLAGICDWPLSRAVLIRTAERLAGAKLRSAGGAAAVGYCWPAIPIRNAFFLLVVLLHGLRRLWPPY